MLFDPRIDPKTTFIIKEKITIHDFEKIIEILFPVDKALDKIKIYSVVLVIFKLYNLESYIKYIDQFEDIAKFISSFEFNKSIREEIDNLIHDNNIEAFEKIKLFKHMRFFIKNNFDIEKSLNDYIWSYRRFEPNKDISRDIEKFVDNTKTYGKYLFSMFLNHMYLITESCKKKYTPILVMNNYFIFNKDFYHFLKQNSFLLEIYQLIKEHNLVSKWMKINNFKNDIFEINSMLKEWRNIHILNFFNERKFLEKMEEFCKKLK